MRVMRVRAIVLGYLLSAIMVAGLCGASAAFSPYSLMPSVANLSPFGFPASLVEPQFGLQNIVMSPDAIVGLTSSFLPDSASSMAFGGLMPGISSGIPGALSGFSGLPGWGSFASPVNYTPSAPMISSLALQGLHVPSMSLLQPQMGGNSAVSPSTANNYTEESDGKTITVKKGDVIHVQLPSRIDQGYIWNMSVTGGLNVTGTRMYPPEQASAIGSNGEIAIYSLQEWDVQALERGTQYVTAICRRAWADGPDDRTYNLTVIVV